MSATIIRGDARNLPLPDASVDLIVTSPPYFGLRSYQDGGEHYGGQIGAEVTSLAYLEALWECTREWMRVLKPEGSLWINLGDKYAGAPSGPRETLGRNNEHVEQWRIRRRGRHTDVPNKSLIGLPWRYAIGAIDQLGLILRAEVIWDKPSALPESVTDRVRRSHEQWFHFTLRPRYYAAVDEVRELYQGDRAISRRIKHPGVGKHDQRAAWTEAHELGRLPGSVWEIASQPLKVPEHLGVDHFAAFPLEFPRRIIRGWSPHGICTACDEARRPVAEALGSSHYQTLGKTGRDAIPSEQKVPGAGGQTRTSNGTVPSYPVRQRRITGYACACPEPTAPTRPAVVLDPFGGTGTTALVASVLGRRGVSIDRSADYCRIAAWRTTDPGERARALEVPKPPDHGDHPTLFEVTP